MRIGARQLDGHLKKGLAKLYAVHGVETLLALEAADRIREAARKDGCDERETGYPAGRRVPIVHHDTREDGGDEQAQDCSDDVHGDGSLCVICSPLRTRARMDTLRYRVGERKVRGAPKPNNLDRAVFRAW